MTDVVQDGTKEEAPNVVQYFMVVSFHHTKGNLVSRLQ